MNNPWQRQFAKWEAQYKQVARSQPVGDWECNTMPEFSTEGHLGFAVEMLLAGESTIAQQLLTGAQIAVARIESEELWRSPRCSGRFPLNYGVLIRVREYTNSLLGTSPDPFALKAGARMIQEWAIPKPRSPWGEIAEAEWLNSIRMLMVARDGAGVLAAAQRRRRFQFDEGEASVATALARQWQSKSPSSPEANHLLQCWIERLRDISFKPDNHRVARLEWAVIWHREMVGPVFDWSEALTAFARA